MRLTFAKGAGKYDRLTIAREGFAPESIDCPKQGILPHDMIHHAVEETLDRRGFFALVAEGAGAGFTVMGGEAEACVERLVETLQAEMWGGRVAADDLIETYRHACDARGHGVVALTAADVEAVRARIDALTALWAEVPVGGELVLEHRG